MNPEVTRLRNDYRACIKLAKETDSKTDDAYFRSEAQESLTALKKICSHDIVVVLSSYHKSYDSFEPSDPEYRICLICGEKENEFQSSQFKKLKTTPIARFEKDAPQEIEYPLNFLLEDCKQVAIEKGLKYFQR